MLQKEKACLEFQCYGLNSVFILFFKEVKNPAKYAGEENLVLL